MLSLMVFFGIAAYFVWCAGRGRRWCRVATGACFVPVLVVAWSRLYLEAHWLTDVPGGFAAGAGYLVLAIVVIARLTDARPRRLTTRLAGPETPARRVQGVRDRPVGDTVRWGLRPYPGERERGRGRTPMTAPATAAIPSACTAMTELESPAAPDPSQDVGAPTRRNVEGESQMLLCRDIVDLVDDYLDGMLDRQDAEALTAHLADCRDCTAFLNTYRGTLRASRRLREEQLPLELRDRLVTFLCPPSSSAGRACPPDRARWWARLRRVLLREGGAT